MTKKKTKKPMTKMDELIEKILKDKIVRREVVAKSFEFFFPLYFGRYMKYETAPFHKEIIDILEDQNNKLAVFIAFRGSAKSTIITVAYVLWAIFGIQQKKFIVLCGRTEREVRVYLANIKDQLESNELLRMDLGPFEEERNSFGNATAITIKKLNAKIIITTPDQSIRGMRYGEHRPDLIILDDVEDTNSVRNQEVRDKIFNWLTSEVIPAGDKDTRLIAIGNLLHEDSLLKRLQQKIENGEMDGIYREYPIIDSNEKPLWPGKYPTPNDIEQERRKTGNTVSWAREFLLKIISNDDQPIKQEWIKTYIGLPPLTFHSYYAMSVDLAISKSDRADYTAIVSALVCGRGKDLRIYILPNPVNERLTSLETIDRIKLIANPLGHSCKIFIEDVQYQSSIAEHLQQDNYKAICVKIHGDKYARLVAANFLVQDGKVLFPEKGAEKLLRQLIDFGITKNDDLADAFSMLLSQILEYDHHRSGARPVQKINKI